MRKFLATLLFLLAVSAPAHADGVLDSRLTPADKQRLADFDATLKVALAELRLARKALNEAQRRVNRLEAQVAALEKRVEQTT